MLGIFFFSICWHNCVDEFQLKINILLDIFVVFQFQSNRKLSSARKHKIVNDILEQFTSQALLPIIDTNKYIAVVIISSNTVEAFLIQHVILCNVSSGSRFFRVEFVLVDAGPLDKHSVDIVLVDATKQTCILSGNFRVEECH